MKKVKKQKAKKIVVGKVDLTPRGFGFLIGAGSDVYIPRKYVRGAFDGDTVRAEIVDGEARVVEVIERKLKEITGTAYRTYGGKGIIQCKGLPDFLVRDMGEVKDGEVVVAKITDYSSCIAVIKEVIGRWDDVTVRSRAAQVVFGVEDMPSAIEKIAKDLTVTDSMLLGRRDYRNDTVITIDGEDSKDFDDGVSLKKIGDVYRLFVHIADVAQFVSANDKIDKEAFKRGTSCYFAGLVVPMLPTKLSNDICSLVEGQDRLTLSVEMEIDESGNVIKSEIAEGIICSRARMTYRQVNDILSGKVTFDAEITDMLLLMKKLAQILKNKRKEAGEITFDLPECTFEIKDGKVVDLQKKTRLVSHDIIEQFMITANEAVARFMSEKNSPFVYRVHTPPPATKLQTLSDFLKATGYGSIPENPKPSDISKLLKSTPDSVKELVSKITLRSMAKASYETKNEGHFGLASECYCHFTSPIRRYSDLAIHRIIKDYLKNGEKAFGKYGEFCQAVAKTGSERERNAEALERKVDDIIKADFMKDKIGCEYDGIISGVTERGIFVELPNTVEGMIKVENLDGYYTYDAVRFRLYSSSKSYCVGDKISVIVVWVGEDKIEFIPQKKTKHIATKNLRR